MSSGSPKPNKACWAARAQTSSVPLGEMFGYSTTLRSLSQGRATYSMEFKHYAEAPKQISEAIINKYTGKEARS